MPSLRDLALWATLLWSSAALAASHPPEQKARSKAQAPDYGPVDLFAPATGESLRFRPYDGKGRPRKAARRELSHFLRCVHTGEERPVDPRLMPVLYRLGQHYGKRVTIYSGYRPPRLLTVPHSRHLSAAAIDFHIPGVRNEDLVRWLRKSFHPVGVGFYPDGVHVHLDVDRQYDAYWVQGGSDVLDLGQRLARRMISSKRRG